MTGEDAATVVVMADLVEMELLNRLLPIKEHRVVRYCR